jgi:glucose-6-phosphate isomerase
MNIQLDQQHLFTTKSGKTEFDQLFEDFCQSRIAIFKQDPPAFIEVLKDAEQQAAIEDFAARQEGKYEQVIVCGIGGSALGARAISEALGKAERLVILDLLDEAVLEQKLTSDLSKTLVLVISKSGTTLETSAQYFLFAEALKRQNLKEQEHLVVITERASKLDEITKGKRLRAFDLQPDLGGRFSVLSAVGLVPLALVGVDIKKLLNGARNALGNIYSTQQDNLSLRLALAEYYFKKPISVQFIYEAKLASLGLFWRQLLAESIGKSQSIGILPHVALGTRDQHSDLQLFSEGPDDKLYTFIHCQNSGQLRLPKINNQDFSYLSKKSFSKLKNAAFAGTWRSLAQKQRPVQILTLEQITPAAIGELILIFEAKIAFLAQLFGVNAYDQPGVEQGKQITKQILNNAELTQDN